MNLTALSHTWLAGLLGVRFARSVDVALIGSGTLALRPKTWDLLLEGLRIEDVLCERVKHQLGPDVPTFRIRWLPPVETLE